MVWLKTKSRNMKLEQGDAFEKENANWLRERLPFYEKIWAAFVGHDGSGWPLPMRDLSAQKEQNRKKFYQSHYTFAIEAFQVEELATGMSKRAGEIKRWKDFAREQQCLISLVSSIGRIRDMFKIMDESLKMGGRLFGPLQDFYAMRSHVLHGPRLPVQLREGLLLIPKIATGNAVSGEWDDKSVWDNVKLKDYVYFADFSLRSCDELFGLLRELHPKVFSAADEYFDGRRVEEVQIAVPQEPPLYDTQHDPAPISASTVRPEDKWW
jgi:hypothetical protein